MRRRRTPTTASRQRKAPTAERAFPDDSAPDARLSVHPLCPFGDLSRLAWLPQRFLPVKETTWSVLHRDQLRSTLAQSRAVPVASRPRLHNADRDSATSPSQAPGRRLSQSRDSQHSRALTDLVGCSPTPPRAN